MKLIYLEHQLFKTNPIFSMDKKITPNKKRTKTNTPPKKRTIFPLIEKEDLTDKNKIYQGPQKQNDSKYTIKSSFLTFTDPLDTIPLSKFEIEKHFFSLQQKTITISTLKTISKILTQ